MDKLRVEPVTRQDCKPFIIGIHYAARMPSVSFAYGLFDADALIGVVTYGTPPSASLRTGIAGPDYAGNVLELNRLCLRHNEKNQASFLVARSLKMLPDQRIVISFADTAQGHVGYVYQACNFTYHGLSAKRTDWKVRGKEHLHGQTVADEFRGTANRAQAMRDKYGDDFYLEPRPLKHRYIYVTGNRRFRRDASLAIRYPQAAYPKK